jgi:hypothetical protein
MGEPNVDLLQQFSDRVMCICMATCMYTSQNIKQGGFGTSESGERDSFCNFTFL